MVFMRHLHIFPTAMNSDEFSVRIVDNSSNTELDGQPNAANKTQDVFVSVTRAEDVTDFSIYYDVLDNYKKKINQNGVISEPEIDDILIGLASYNNTLAFELKLTDSNIGYVNATGLGADTIALMSADTTQPETAKYIAQVFLDRAREYASLPNPFPGQEFFQLLTSYSGDYQTCKNLDFSYSVADGIFNYSITLDSGEATLITLEDITPITLGSITFNKQLKIVDKGITSTMLATNNVFYQVLQASARTLPDGNGRIYEQAPLNAGFIDPDTQIYYPNMSYDGLGLDLVTTATQLEINGAIYSTSFYNSVSSNDEVVARSIISGKKITTALSKVFSKRNANYGRRINKEKRIKSALMDYALAKKK